MKNLLSRLLIALGFISFFKGTSSHFIAHAKEGSATSGAAACDTMGGRSGGCSKCN